MAFEKLLAKPVPYEVAKTLVEGELRRILSVCNPKVVYLFGSASRNELKDCSDLDFLIVLNQSDRIKDIKKAYYTTTQKREIPVDAVFVLKDEFEKRQFVGGICFMCRAEGKVLYRSED